MEFNAIIWAVLTSGITAAVWTSIVLLGRQKRLAAEHKELLEDRQRTLDELQVLSARLIEVEDRLDFAERLIPKPTRSDETTPRS